MARLDINFCQFSKLLPLLFLAEIVALVTAIATADNLQQFWSLFAMLLLYLLWISLLLSSLLCMLRNWLVTMATTQLLLTVTLLLLFTVTLVTELGIYALQHLYLPDFISISPYLRIQIYTIALIIAAVGLRYLYVLHSWQDQIRSEANHRFQALQERIRPHFLFNTLNSITALVSIEPQKAESALLDLADLLRFHLQEPQKQITLQQEQEIVQRYIAIEQLRLEDRLQVEWSIDPTSLKMMLPPLTLQPLVENAIYHGIERCSSGGKLRISTITEERHWAITVSNPLGDSPQRATLTSNRVALANISSRLQQWHDGSGTLETKMDTQHFTATLRLPLVCSV